MQRRSCALTPARGISHSCVAAPPQHSGASSCLIGCDALTLADWSTSERGCDAFIKLHRDHARSPLFTCNQAVGRSLGPRQSLVRVATSPQHPTQGGAGSRGAVQDRPWLPPQGACRGRTRSPWAREAVAWWRRRRAQPCVSGTRVAVDHRMAIRPSTATSNGCASVPRYATSASISTGPPTWFVAAVSTVKLSPPAAMKLLAATT